MTTGDRIHVSLRALAIGIVALTSLQARLLTFASGLGLPEDINAIPSGFNAQGRRWFVTDPNKNFAGPNNIIALTGTGIYVPFVTLPAGDGPIAGAFLGAGPGALAGQYIVAGGDFGRTNGFISAINQNATITPLVNSSGDRYSTAALAPSGFGSFGGDVLVAREDGSQILAITPGGGILTFAGNVGTSTFGSAFAPSGFGSVGGDLLLSALSTGGIYAVDASGNVKPFATIPLGPANVGLRQMAFAPAGFGQYGGDLIVSVAGGNGVTAGTFGYVAAVNSSGQVVGQLQSGDPSIPFDPRGLFFPDSSDLFISAVDPIYVATPQDFTPVTPTPEPGSLGLVFLSIPLLAFARRKLKQLV